MVSAEGEGKSFDTCVEKLDLELAINDGTWLPDQLIHPRFGQCAGTFVVHINAVSIPRRASINEHPKSHGSSRCCGAHHEMQISSVKVVRDAAIGLIQYDGFCAHRPIAGKSPLIK